MSAITEHLEKMIGRRVRVVPEYGAATDGILRFVDASGRFLIEVDVNVAPEESLAAEQDDIATRIQAIDPFHGWTQVYFLKEP